MLPEEVTRFIGKKGPPSVFVVEKEAIRRFADAVDDPNPLYWDDDYAKESRHGSILAPPGFISAPWFSGRPRKWGRKGEGAPDETAGARPAIAKAGFGRILDGGIEYEFTKPVKAGDTITSQSTITDITVREGSTGKMVFMTTETTYTNQDGEVIATSRGTGIHPEGEPGS
ncbi:MAG: MaoC family dehydratase N-terminal domain-containing protein [Desulfobacterales bacterium]